MIMSNFTDISNNTANTANTADITINTTNEPHENTILSLEVPYVDNLTSPHDTIGILHFPVSEEIEKCSPRATFTTYKMGGSTGLSKNENQDACSVISITKNGIKFAVVTVCDGHGQYGQMYANCVVSMLPQLVVESFDYVLDDPVQSLKNIFHQVSNNIDNNRLLKSGGTTVTIAIFTDGLLICANVGDCEALLKTSSDLESIKVERNGQIEPVNISNNVIRATTDHNCNNYKEVVRVLETGARVMYASSLGRSAMIDAYTCVVNSDCTKSYINTPHSKQRGRFVSNISNDPAIYFVGGGMLNMTRSLGDHESWFLSKEPDVTKITWNPNDRAKLLVASDGYFNCFSKHEQEQEMSFDISPTEMCQNAHITVGKVFGHKYADNTTIVVLETGTTNPV
jgi:serine/threonine protein phosphatase PrpC